MSRFLSNRYTQIEPYSPGEQPEIGRYIKLNTNENPYPPSPLVQAAVKTEATRLNLYSDPTCSEFLAELTNYLGVEKAQLFAGNGSDEVLSIIFQSMCENSVAFADITYGFYSVYAKLYGLKQNIIPLRADFTLATEDYLNLNSTVVIANPNAPTGLAISLSEIEKILQHNRQNLVVIDEAYVEFGADSAIPLLKEYDNLVIVGTFSKSRSLAGARLGYAVSSTEIIEDMNRIKYSINPYNVNRMTLAAGIAALKDIKYHIICRNNIMANRTLLSLDLVELGFEVLESKANFVFCSHPIVEAQQIYLKLKEDGILVRWFERDRIKNYLRISVGSSNDCVILIDSIKKILQKEAT
ncbi:MAG: histidinol-phosphate transaminase [Oscillospiraceae bacterium]|nr:histidinol-phosphate transaminase [Oscillospiraceae bacterium]